jgi:hypothetical protein
MPGLISGMQNWMLTANRDHLNFGNAINTSLDEQAPFYQAASSSLIFFGVGINRVSPNASKLDFGDVIVDNAVYSSGELNRIRMDMTAGLYL